MALTDKLKALADVIREKTGYEGTMTLDEMVEILRAMDLVSDGTVAYILVDENGNEVTAVMTEVETELTATANDIRLGTTAVTVDGITEGKLEVDNGSVENEPIAYMYTDTMTLPPIPEEWDSIRYPHLAIYKHSDATRLYMCDTPCWARLDDDGRYWVHYASNSGGEQNNICISTYTLSADGASWEHTNTVDNVYALLYIFNVDDKNNVWFNHNVYEYDSENDDNIIIGYRKPTPVMKGIVAYLYNGERLPPTPPEVDTERYPTAVITKNTFDLNTGRWIYWCTGFVYKDGYVYIKAPYVSGAASIGDETWNISKNSDGTVKVQETDTNTSKPGSDRFIWTNTDILYTTGSVALAATDPIPVYE